MRLFSLTRLPFFYGWVIVAVVFGTPMLTSIVGGAAGPWLTGVIRDATGSYALAFWIAIGCCVLSVVAIWLAAPRKVRAVAGRIRFVG